MHFWNLCIQIQSWCTFTNWNDFKPRLHDSLLLPEACPFLPTWLPVALLFPRALSADTLSAAPRSVIFILLGGPLLPHELKDWSSSLIRRHIVQPRESFLFLTEPIGWVPSLFTKFWSKVSSSVFFRPLTHQHHLTRALRAEAGPRAEQWGFCLWALYFSCYAGCIGMPPSVTSLSWFLLSPSLSQPLRAASPFWDPGLPTTVQGLLLGGFSGSPSSRRPPRPHLQGFWSLLRHPFRPEVFHGLFRPCGCRVRHNWATFTFTFQPLLPHLLIWSPKVITWPDAWHLRISPLLAHFSPGQAVFTI